MSRKVRHVVVIDPGSRVPELDAFNRLSLATSERLSLHLPALHGICSLHDLEQEPDGVIILGSGASVYDNHEWQAALTLWLENILAKQIPLLGICYGHQLLAHLLGGTVAFIDEDHTKLTGSRQVAYSADGFWGHSREQATFVVSHREIVTQLPTDCALFASSDAVRCEGFYHTNRPIWGIQAHPEAGPGFLRNQDIKLAIPADIPFKDGQRFLSGFLQWIHRSR
jgi:GMP synthase (glutamine-hydrolysing)